MSDLLTTDEFRVDGWRKGGAFGASLASPPGSAGISRIQSLRLVVLAGKRSLHEQGCSSEKAQAWAEGYVSGFEPHAELWFQTRFGQKP
jgi:hypothetical protein